MNLQEQQKLLKKIQETLKQYLQPSDTILLATSGGPDSIFLFHQLKNYKNLHLAHLNHKLRPEADQEEDYVKSLLPTTQVHTKTQNFTNFTEEKGRKARYQFFQDTAKKINAKFIITAHHADDNLETILLNFTRGATLKGLTGMSFQNKQLLRPLLNISKKDIIDYLDTNDIKYFQDSSNQDPKYTRNFLRHQVIPELQTINPNLTTTVQKNTDQLREIQDYLESESQKWLQENRDLPLKKLQKLHPALLKQIILEIYKQHTKNTKNIETIHLQEIQTLINSNIGNKNKQMGALQFSTKNGKLMVQKAAN